MSATLYHRTQCNVWLRVALALAAATAAVLALAQSAGLTAPLQGISASAAWLLAVILTASLQMTSMTVRMDAESLQLHFGFGWPRKRFALAQIIRVEVAHTRWYEGLGIHWTNRGWLYNVQGFGAIQLHLLDGRRARIGSDEPQRLSAALQRALAGSPHCR